MICAICRSTLLVRSCHLGEVRWYLCEACGDSAGAALAVWAMRRTEELRRQADLRAARAAGERSADELAALASEEALPLSTRRAMRAAQDKGAA